MDRSTLAIHAGRGPRTPGAPLNPPLVLASSFHGGDYAREEGAPTLGGVRGGAGRARGRRGRWRSRAARRRPRRSSRRCRRARAWSGPERGYAWTRSLLAERAATGRIALQTVDTSDTEATLAVRARARTCCGSSRRATRCWRWPSSTACAGVASRSRWTPRSPRRCCSGRWSSGAAFSLHSATKFIGGHSDLLLGVVSVRDDARLGALQHARAQVGATPGTLEAFLALRGLRTLPVRLELSQRDALQTLAERLSAHPAVSAVPLPRRSGRCSPSRSAATRCGLRGGSRLHLRQEPRRRREPDRPPRAVAPAVERRLRARRGPVGRPRCRAGSRRRPRVARRRPRRRRRSP